MRFAEALSLGALLAAGASADCSHNNCLRAVIASANPDRNGAADCASYFSVTVTPTTSWSTITSTPTSIPKYASACSGSVAYSSACSCVSAVHKTQTIYPSIPSTDGYLIVSPTSCPASAPTGSVVEQSDAAFSDANSGLQYTEYANAQFVLQNSTSGSFFVDASNPSQLTASDGEGNTLIIHADGTFQVFLGNCALEIGGSWLDGAAPGKRDNLSGHLTARDLCSATQGACNSDAVKVLAVAAGQEICKKVAVSALTRLGIGFGALGNIGGPFVGLPAMLGGAVLGNALGRFLINNKIGNAVCGLGMVGLFKLLCSGACFCPSGTARCTPGGPCVDTVSNANNCGSCGHVCPSGLCAGSVCTTPIYYDDNGLDDAAFT